jgi:ribosomal protein S18 acetylase RimI-like enzyme
VVGPPAEAWENERVLRVRPARPEDAADVAAVHVRSWQVAYRGLIADGYLDSLRPEDRMARYTFGSRDPRQPSTFVATEDGFICGFATTGPSRDTDVAQRGELFGLYVDPPAWGRGTGRRLMVQSRRHLCRRGFTDAVLWVLVGNERAERFYRADGWLPDGRRQSDEIWGVTVDEICYRRDLP